MNILVSILSLVVSFQALAVSSSGKETRAEIVCQEINPEPGPIMIMLIQQTSTLYNDGSEVKHMQGKEFVKKSNYKKTPILDASVKYFQKDSSEYLEKDAVDKIIRNSTPYMEKVGQIGRYNLTYGFRYGEGTQDKSDDLRLQFATTDLEGVFMREGHTEIGAGNIRQFRCEMPSYVEVTLPTEAVDGEEYTSAEY